MKNDFIVDKPEGKRWDLALDILCDGKPFVFQGIIFALDKAKKALYCGIEVDTSNPGNITEERALREYEEAKRIVGDLIGGSKKFKNLIAGFKQEFSIVNDYGTGVVELFSVSDGKVIRK